MSKMPAVACKRVNQIARQVSAQPLASRATIAYLKPHAPGICERIAALSPPQEQLSPEEVELSDLRPLPGGSGQLDSLGFVLAGHTSAIQDLFAVRLRGAARRTYYREMAELAKRLTGATEARVFSHFIRSPRHAHLDGVDGFYATAPHNDFTPAEEQGLWATAEQQLGIRRPQGRRLCVLNLWRPLVDRAQNTLAVCDARTVDNDVEAVPMTIPRPTGNSDVYRYVHSARHRWYYAPDMTHDEVLVFKTYDSLDDGTAARFTPHCAVTDPTARDGAPQRESIECRCYCIF